MPLLKIPCPGEQGILPECWCLDVSALAHSHDFQTGLDRVLDALHYVSGVNEVKTFAGERQLMNIGQNEWLIICDQGFVSEFRLQETLGKDRCVWKRLSAAPDVEDTHARLDLEVDMTCLIVETSLHAWEAGALSSIRYLLLK